MRSLYNGRPYFNEVAIMNPYTKIEKLNKKIEKMQAENDNLLYQLNDAEKIRRESELKLKLADEKELEYSKLINELKKEMSQYELLNSKLAIVIKNVKNTYKKSFNEIKREMIN